MVQLLTGPLDPSGAVQGAGRQAVARDAQADGEEPHGAGRRSARRTTSSFYLEALTFTPLNRLDQQIGIVGRDGLRQRRPGARFLSISGTAARSPRRSPASTKKLIFLRRFLRFARSVRNGTATSPSVGANVWTGGGRIPLKEWVDAVKATGFDGIWRCELLSPTILGTRPVEQTGTRISSTVLSNTMLV